MAVNYKRRKSNITNRDWSNYSEKDNAKYMSKQLRDFGYKVPSYMKKGKINLKQIETYANRIINKLTHLAEKQRLSKMSPAERRRETQISLQKDIDKYNDFIKNELTKGIPQELRKSDAFMKYMTKGEFITNRWRGYDLHASGYEVLNVKNVKELQKYTNSRSNKKLKDFIDNELENAKLNTYENKVKQYKKDILTELERMNTLDEKGNLQLSDKTLHSAKILMDNLNLLELMELNNQITRSETVFDSITDKYGGNSDKALNAILNGMLNPGEKGYRFNIEEYGN